MVDSAVGTAWNIFLLWCLLGLLVSVLWGRVVKSGRDPELPDRCQQFGCSERAETYCPLCRAFFCHVHDPLYPRRMHDCLKGKAEAA